MAINYDAGKALDEIGRAQAAWKDYKAAGRDDLAQNAHNYADQQRAMYTKAGGNAADVAADKNYESRYKGSAPASNYDPTKSGMVERSAAPAASAPAAPSRPQMAPGMSWEAALNQSRGQFDPLRQNSMTQIANQYNKDKISTDQVAAARGLGHSGLAADQFSKLAGANQATIADTNNKYDSQIASLANQVQQQDRNFNMQKWMADNANFNSDRGFNYQQSRDQVGDSHWQNQFDYNKAVTDSGITGQYNGNPTFAYQQWKAGNDLANKSFDLNKAISEAGLTGIYNGADTMQKKQIEDAMKLQWSNFNLAQQQANNSNSLGWAQLNQAGNQWQQQFDQAGSQWQQQFNQSQTLNNQDMMLNKFNLISQLNNLPADKAATYLQNFTNMGLFSPQEASTFIGYWKNGQPVPASSMPTSSYDPLRNTPFAGK